MSASILAADIGGTSCRFGLFSLDQGTLELRRHWRVSTSSLRTTGEFLTCCRRYAPLSSYDAFVVALAGPVNHPYQGKLSNAPLTLDLRELARQGRPRCLCINDFLAQAWSCLTAVGQTVLPLGSPGLRPGDGARRIAIIGAGTGLGMAALLRDNAGRWQALPSEGGHCLFPFQGEEEYALQRFLQRDLGVEDITGDDLLSGRGLQCLHTFLTGERWEAARIGREALSWESPTLTLFARLYGRSCRHWALTTLCDAGLYITGGIAMRNPLLVRCQAFQQEFLHAPGCLSGLRRIPLFLFQGDTHGLWGAAYAAQRLLED